MQCASAHLGLYIRSSFNGVNVNIFLTCAKVPINVSSTAVT
ncbi:hypothetical protein D0911_17535 [Zhongshania marina]|uniref:Uncharacterized protein n=1 Tax=Zhongshania marina TaxID=2304603 RepID=A0A2S4HGX7_9GAMM|nr:hypothetical protein C0068_09145 [Marortus luteolus]RNL58697.1 hypothetical protein D0911_17535 [Zhongshania marina]